MHLLQMVGVWIHSLRSGQKGQSMTEYALILGLIAVVVIVILSTMGGTIKEVFTEINTELGAVLE